MKKITGGVVILLFFAGAVWPQSAEKGQEKLAVVPYDDWMDVRVSVDGFVDLEEEEPEYPGKFVDPATGITLYWGYDDSLLYVALEAKGTGWMALGLGSAVMDGANIFIGYYTDDSTLVANHIGKGHKHQPVTGVDLLEDWEIDYDEETNTMTMEFVYPLDWTGLKGTKVSGLAPGDTFDFILARNPKSASFMAKHARISAGKLMLAPKPEEVEGEGAPAQPPAEGKEQK